jgi:hypothetical protein
MFGSYSGMLTTTTDNGIRENGIVLDGVQADGSVNTVNCQQLITEMVSSQQLINKTYLMLIILN